MASPLTVSNERLCSLLEQIDLMRAMFPLEGELIIDKEAISTLDQLYKSERCLVTNSYPETISLKVRVQTSSTSSSAVSNHCAYLCCSIDTVGSGIDGGVEFWVDRHSSLPRSLTDSISDRIKNHQEPRDRYELDRLTETTFELIQVIQNSLEDIGKLQAERSSSSTDKSQLDEGLLTVERSQSFTRVWLRLPSLSSREKRDDMISFAAEYGITGFVLAGKPALVCLESLRSESIDRYMSKIKTVSWSDIPPFQKKVSEILRESDVSRNFDGMVEITEDLKKKGFRNFRTDFGEIVSWLKEHCVQPEIIESILGISFV
ncbi:hypothetical protein BY996DRAFT_3814277 [Phakopsora pachyrhizi]|uniref:Expressed protein n=1 Tax=Phakopsora pachyrhizi TaxID=170000 RepID=A0AAV0BPY1_PHAPC|nr:hypothetical protein BY996DRAFT_3814277 [Phakopsora pachyrhizi]CAH7688701.1 expressed protein [Phakopsora pachyrhizi]